MPTPSLFPLFMNTLGGTGTGETLVFLTDDVRISLDAGPEVVLEDEEVIVSLEKEDIEISVDEDITVEVE